MKWNRGGIKQDIKGRLNKTLWAKINTLFYQLELTWGDLSDKTDFIGSDSSGLAFMMKKWM